ncbi:MULTISPECIES: single-stranded DNA-binding protein [unclassified Nitratiruptor]|uniref:single-stranded DNA-binding protein n=1 Tax=unclassified Nitratiruptor TaxID=2624044 RepID=UPI001915540A|nr:MULTISPECIES: single-stranded DNA-binding protein [unclassified Nitratiruptor]BCD59598.1 single-strand DNA-binding protein [Nitratiruptor sp. YY08-10]BCD63522.1 single-strand DNA-binding protein [Nitratiruptor sp. YY08-14]BCD83074.1 single-strand DNA-binding protein [Nitratiruptor phage NrS-2]BCD83140.1 single-strand DNA-binding protein [Nitratiruptor phage NrS-3]
MNLNKVILLGNIVRDIELRYTSSGTAISKTAIAVNRKYKTQSGEQKEEVCFIDITFFGRSAEIANQYLGKGKQVLIEGRLVQEQWTDSNGQKRSKHSVQVENMQMLGCKQDGQQTQQVQQPEKTVQRQKQANRPEMDIDDDEIPF